MRKYIKFLIALLVGVSLFYFVAKETGVDAIREASTLFLGKEGLVILLVTFLIVLLGALRWKEILRSEGADVPFFRTVRYLVKGFTVDFLTPFSLFGGEAIRIFLMEKEVGIKKSAFSCITDKIMDVTAHFAFLVFGTVLFVIYGVSHHSFLLLYALITSAFIFLLLLLFYRKVLRKKSFLHWVFDILGISKKYFKDSDNGKAIIEVEKKLIFFFSTKRKDFLQGMLLSFVRHFLFLFRIFLIIFFITGTVDIGVAVVVYALVILSMLLPLPAALGGMELILGLGFTALGFSFIPGVMLAITLRGADLLVCFWGIILFIRFSLISFIKKFTKPLEEQ